MSIDRNSLCHPDDEKSCGLCCGCYNSPNFFYRPTMSRLRRRTARFARIEDPTNVGQLEAFRDSELTIQTKLVRDVPNCPFVGLLSEDDSPQIGCLVHPKQLGVDRRDCGVHDAEICADFLCASHSVLTKDEADLVVAAVHDSYTYGLVITDPNFIRELFDRVADINHRAMDSRDVENPRVISEASRYFALKVDWPYGTDDAILGQATVGENLSTLRRGKPEPSTEWDTIALCLGTDVGQSTHLGSARRQIRRRVLAVAAASAEGR